MSRPSFGRALWQLAITAAVLGQGVVAYGQLPFFPGAEGFGGTFSGTAPAGGWFSNATVYHVTTTEDDLGTDGKGAPGTLRGAFRENTANKIIVFDVGGTIQLNDNLDIKNVQNYYIAGQTAPSPVTVYGNSTNITHSNNKQHFNTILRYMTFRRGTDAGEDALGVIGGGSNGIANNIMIDHVTATWSKDENLSVTNYNTNVTVQYSLIAEAINSSHAYGSLLRPKNDALLTFHHNLYATDRSRNPRPGTYDNKQLDLDFRNNVIYNWSDRAGYTGGANETETEYVNINYVGNYAIAGPLTPVGQTSQTLYTMDVSKFYNLSTGQLSGENKDPLAIQIYQSGNYIDSNHNATRDGSNTGWGMFIASDGEVSNTTVAYPEFNYGPNSALPAKRATAFDYAPVTTQSAPAAYDQVLEHVGNFWWARDAIDSRIISNVQSNTTPAWNASGLIDAEKTAVAMAPDTAHPANYDADNDGMKDEWEAKHGGNLVWNADFDNDGYINLIEFINELGEFPAPAPIVFNSGLNDRYAHIMNWKTSDGITAGSNWQPSKYDEAQINSGTVVVDAVGQHAGLLKIASNSGNFATLRIADGWLEVAEETQLGVAPNSDGRVRVVGTNTTRFDTGLLVAGVFGLGSLDIQQGTVNSSGAVLGMGSDSAGEVFVRGATSSWNVMGDVFVGLDGGGNLYIGDGGTVTAENVIVGYDGRLGGDGTVTGNVENHGYIRPGGQLGAGTLTIEGDVQQIPGEGILSLDIESPTSFDRLVVQGDVEFGGVLEVKLLDDFMPAIGTEFDVLDWTGARTGQFDILALDDLGTELAWDTSLVDSQGVLKVVAAAIDLLAGDFNDDGTVDAADYAVWRNAMSGIGSLANETESIGTVDQFDYNAWKSNFGAVGGGDGANSVVPEPTGFVLVLAAVASLGARLRTRRPM